MHLSLVQVEANRTAFRWAMNYTIISETITSPQRFLNAQTQKSLIFARYPQTEYAKVQKYQEQDWEQLIETWKHANLHIKKIVERIPQDVLNKSHHKHNFHEIASRFTPSGKPVTLRFLIEDYYHHMVHHLNQIFSMHGLDNLSNNKSCHSEFISESKTINRKKDSESSSE